MSVSKHNLAVFVTIVTALSLIVGYGLSNALKKTRIFNLDSYLWASIAIFCALASPFLNDLLPDKGFPFSLFAGTWLSWMLMLSSAFSWRDNTLLFLNIPCLSIFALVGTFDTYPPSTVFFFIFIICSSLLYARIHKRAMVRRAQEAGVEDPNLLDRDAWRWMAGPEWAMASAAVIILVSLLVGPILKYSLQTVSGSVKVQVASSTAPVTTAQNNYDSDISIGRGAVSLTENPVFLIKTDVVKNLRQSYYSEYSGSGWNRTRVPPLAGIDLSARIKSWPSDQSKNGWMSAWPEGIPLEPLSGPTIREIQVKAMESGLSYVPTPGPIVEIKPSERGNFVFTASGGLFKRGGLGPSEKLVYRFLDENPSVKPGKSEFESQMQLLDRNFADASRVTPAVRQFAQDAVAGISDDYNKALALKHAIETRAGYTLKPPALSSNEDAVEQFLFKTRRGYCDLFGTSMAVCGRAIGLRTRYVVGFTMTDLKVDSDGFYTVRDHDAHAWCEVYLQNKGWVTFDATEGAEMLDDNVVESKTLWYQTPTFIVIAIIVGMASLFPLFLGIRFLVRLAKSSRPVNSVQSQVAPLHRQFDRILRKKTGVTRRFSQTTREYVDQISGSLGAAQGLVLELRELLELACFSPHVPDLKLLGQKLKELHNFKIETRSS